jgi:hypothetical protein
LPSLAFKTTFFPEERVAIYRRLPALSQSKVRALHDTARANGSEYPSIRSAVDWLDDNGEAMVKKPLKAFTELYGHRLQT